MNNETFLKQAQIYYSSLANFDINDNVLILKNNNEEQKTTIYYTYLANLNPNIFLLSPEDIFSIIRLLELLYKGTLTEDDINFITSYTERYLNLNDRYVQSIENNADGNQIYYLGMPIYTSYDANFASMPASILIQDVINNHTTLSNNSQNKGPKLVLTNKSLFNLEEEQDNLRNFEKAGFSVIMLIVGTVVVTTLYIAFFIVNKA